MNSELERAFYEVYPWLHTKSEDFLDYPQTIFEEWGFQCGPGWVPLLVEFCDMMEIGKMAQHIEIIQIKEKYFSLRIYATTVGYFEEILDDYIEELEYRSRSKCEVCGKDLFGNDDCDHNGLTLAQINGNMLGMIRRTGQYKRI